MGFLAVVAACALSTLLFSLWWLFDRRLSLADRFAVFGVAGAGGVAAALTRHPSLNLFAFLTMSLPWLLTAWAAWLVLARKASARTRRLGLVTVLCLTWGSFTLVRQDGLQGDGQADLHWRWRPTPEELYLAEAGQSAPQQPGSHEGLRLRDGDWPGFRGPRRDGDARGARVAVDWGAAPPRLVWRRRVGPAWSSAAVVGERLFTQEQVGGEEAVVCLDAATGRTVWSHRDAARHEDGQSGVGPRATPTFADGRLYALGATGVLNCLDAATGERAWARDVAADAGAKVPLWGFSSSPLVAGGLVVVFAGGDPERSLRAYRAGTGEPAWAAPGGETSYSSPQLAELCGREQILFVSDRGLTAVEPTSGAVLWEHRTPPGNPGMPRAVQPHPVGAAQVLFDSGAEAGTALVEVSHEGGSWGAAQRWTSRQLKPAFDDLVVCGGAAYGFDGRAFTCVDVGTGRRRWKDGRYGSGQVLLLGDQPVLLVVTDSGEAVLVAADPDRHTELGRFQAVSGKTWNHAVVAHGRLYVRNAAEMACYELVPAR
jgi:outer membrane protein assembly factor BamB